MMGQPVLEQKLREKQFVVTTEVTPPVAADRSVLLEQVVVLRGLVDAVNVTDGAGARAQLDVMTAAALIDQAGLEPIMQITCRDRTRIALQSLLLGAGALGIANLLMLRGDDPSAGDQPAAKPVFDLDAIGLLSAAVAMRRRGELPHGKHVTGEAHFFLGAA